MQALLEETGYPSLTMEAVAARAGVGKATLYRRWRSKPEMVFGCLVHDHELVAPDTGSLHGDLVALAGAIVADLTAPAVAQALPGLLADLVGDPDLRGRFDRAFIHPERGVVAAVLDRAAQRSELSHPGDADLAHALLLGTVFGWLFLLNRPPNDVLGDWVADLAAAAFGRVRT